MRLAFQLINIGILFFMVACKAQHDLPTQDESLNFKKFGVSFEMLNEKILIPHCLRCHRSSQQSNHYINLSNYENIVNSGVFPPLVVNGQPEQSSLYTSVKKFRMPKQGPILTQQKIEYIRTWILLGAKKEKISVAEPSEPDSPGYDCHDVKESEEPGAPCNCDEYNLTDEPCDYQGSDPNEP